MCYLIRPIEPSDESFLWEMLYQAIYVPTGTTPLPKEIIYQPELAKYVQDWTTNDIGLIAASESNQTPIGATWIRLFNMNNPGYGYINDETPELSIAVLPEYRNQGIGTRLILDLLEIITDLYPAISLSVSSENPALRLYQRLDFEVVSQFDNSVTMKKKLK
ncbi:GCN5-related N-acetyltransferase [Calothrix parasitica NIES-267]|uniref:GCN5-related N-acetyltransferase n=1 Tax=Calothrix parasitica NIES-267 TaxID=1973488 RepID=A0A1Z4LXH5_9CYAN|nr:GCN5-related N-acetyltransferase [Calothrix parasitica NIES-267]